ncbi:MAG: cbb3-type cytochrome oxidase assembly protein CcoS [Desulfobacteraceae bacterium]|nr:cbb3-type cytochrome oxidase assembly protein CcoS [Desulfobacteraceae bacterium]
MYFPYFIAYISIGLAVSLITFFWALKNGQFQEQQRARYIPLRGDEGVSPTRVTRAGRLEIYGLFFLAVAGLSASGAVLVCALYFR